MKIFLDTTDMKETKKWLPVIEGVTTNPGLLEKHDVDLRALAELIYPYPISIEACGDFIKDARYWAGTICNAVIKIPLLNCDGGNNIRLIKELSKEGVKINCTALMSLSQVILAEKAGARYVSLFAGRVDDEGGDYQLMIGDCVNVLETAELIIGSIRTVGNILDAVRAGAHIVTIPPAILEKMVNHSNSLRTVREFEDAHRRLSKGDTEGSIGDFSQGYSTSNYPSI